MTDPEKLEKTLEYELKEVSRWADGQTAVESDHDLVIADLLEAHKHISRAGMLADILCKDYGRDDLKAVLKAVKNAETELQDKILYEMKREV